MTFFRASLETRNFHFEAFDVTEAAARETLRLGLLHHARDYAIPADWLKEFVDDIHVAEIGLGTVLRDRQQMEIR